MSFLSDRSVAVLKALEDVSKGQSVNLVILEVSVFRPTGDAEFSLSYYNCTAGTVTTSYTLDGYKVTNLPLTPQGAKTSVDNA